MSYCLCTDCLTVFRKDALAEHNHELAGKVHICPIPTCHGWCYEIDEIMLPTVQVLNMKGYRTLHSCSGHLYEHVDFAECILGFKDMLPSIPDGFKLEVEESRCVLRAKIEGSTMLERMEYWTDMHKRLYKWARGLDKKQWGYSNANS